MVRTRVDDRVLVHLDDGPADGPAVVLQHGFPDDPRGWDALAGALVAAGHRVVRPWLRGQHPAGSAAGSRTAVDDLVADLHGLVDALGLDRPALVGHDWGAVAAWASAARADAPWRQVVALAVPPPPIQARLARDPAQVGYRSGYMLWMLVPGVERVMPAIAARLWRRWSPGWSPPAAHVARVRRAMADPGTARAAAGLYRHLVPRALIGRHPADPDAAPTVPVLHLHGDRDACLPARARGGALHPSTTLVHGAGHWLHLELPDVVQGLVLRALSRAA